MPCANWRCDSEKLSACTDCMVTCNRDELVLGFEGGSGELVEALAHCGEACRVCRARWGLTAGCGCCVEALLELLDPSTVLGVRLFHGPELRFVHLSCVVQAFVDAFLVLDQLCEALFHTHLLLDELFCELV